MWLRCTLMLSLLLPIVAVTHAQSKLPRVTGLSRSGQTVSWNSVSGATRYFYNLEALNGSTLLQQRNGFTSGTSVSFSRSLPFDVWGYVLACGNKIGSNENCGAKTAMIDTRKENDPNPVTTAEPGGSPPLLVTTLPDIVPTSEPPIANSEGIETEITENVVVPNVIVPIGKSVSLASSSNAGGGGGGDSRSVEATDSVNEGAVSAKCQGTVYMTYPADSWGVQCKRITAAGIGNEAVLSEGFVAAIDVWAGSMPTGAQACFYGHSSGKLTFLDAATSPRAASVLEGYEVLGMICGWMPGQGSLVLGLPDAAAPAPEEPAAPAAKATPYPVAGPETALSACELTTTDHLRFRLSVWGGVIAVIAPGETVSATASAVAGGATWYKVAWSDRVGWIHGGFVSGAADCA